MYLVELDRSQRLLVISAAQHVTADETNKTVEELRGLLKDIAPGLSRVAGILDPGFRGFAGVWGAIYCRIEFLLYWCA